MARTTTTAAPAAPVAAPVAAPAPSLLDRATVSAHVYFAVDHSAVAKKIAPAREAELLAFYGVQ